MELSHTAVRAKIQKANPKKCYKCGSMPHPKHECPANDAKCHYCGENGYGQCVCFAGKAVCGMEEDKSFLCSVTSAIIPKHPFQTGIGMDITVVLQTVFKLIFFLVFGLVQD